MAFWWNGCSIFFDYKVYKIYTCEGGHEAKKLSHTASSQ